MARKGQVDSQVAKAIGLSRPQVSRLRRGVTVASPATAHRLEKLTGIRWYVFIEKNKRRKVKRAVQ